MQRYQHNRSDNKLPDTWQSAQQSGRHLLKAQSPAWSAPKTPHARGSGIRHPGTGPCRISRIRLMNTPLLVGSRGLSFLLLFPSSSTATTTSLRCATPRVVDASESYANSSRPCFTPSPLVEVVPGDPVRIRSAARSRKFSAEHTAGQTINEPFMLGKQTHRRAGRLAFPGCGAGQLTARFIAESAPPVLD